MASGAPMPLKAAWGGDRVQRGVYLVGFMRGGLRSMFCVCCCSGVSYLATRPAAIAVKKEQNDGMSRTLLPQTPLTRNTHRSEPYFDVRLHTHAYTRAVALYHRPGSYRVSVESATAPQSKPNPAEKPSGNTSEHLLHLNLRVLLILVVGSPVVWHD